MDKKIISLSAALALGFSLPSHAADTYLAIDVGASNASVERFHRNLAETECVVSAPDIITRCDLSKSQQDWVGYIGLGIKLNSVFAFELGYFDLMDDTSRVDIEARSGTDPNYEITGWQDLTLELSAVTFRGVAEIPITEKLSADVHLGLSQLRQKRVETGEYSHLGDPLRVTAGDTDIVPTYGVGLSYQLGGQWRIRAQYLIFDHSSASSVKNDRSLQIGTIGISYQF